MKIEIEKFANGALAESLLLAGLGGLMAASGSLLFILDLAPLLAGMAYPAMVVGAIFFASGLRCYFKLLPLEKTLSVLLEESAGKYTERETARIQGISRKYDWYRLGGYFMATFLAAAGVVLFALGGHVWEKGVCMGLILQVMFALVMLSLARRRVQTYKDAVQRLSLVV